MNLRTLTVSQAHRDLKSKKYSAQELAKSCLQRIRAVDEELKAFITVCGEQALLRAAEIDEKIKAGEELGPLDGIPFSAKDLFCTAGVQSTAGSRILEGFEPPYSASVIEKLSGEGAVLMGKNTEDEFGHGASSENTGFETPRNPWDRERTAGGSSGGSAVAVAAGEALFSLGTDTGGSVRLPAALCGIVGLKPSYGRISRYGVIAMASSLDTVGCFARTVEDISSIMQALAGNDPLDSTTPLQPVPEYAAFLKKGVKGLKIGVPKEYFVEDFPADVLGKVREAIEILKKMGAKVQEISLPHTKYGVAVYYIVCPCEVSANMARYDGIRYGPTVKGVSSLEELYLENRTKFHPEVKRRIMIGTYALSSGYYDAYYLKAQKVRTLIKQDFERAFEDVDVIAAPTAPFTAFKIGERVNDPLQMYLGDILTIPASLGGICSLNLPCGQLEGLPVGFQVMGPQFAEERLLQVGAAYEKEVGGFAMPVV